MPVPLQPGNTPVFTVTPVFSGEAFALSAANAFVSSSDPVNFPVELAPSDATGKTFQAAIPTTLKAATTVTVVWQYHNPDGTTAVVSGSVLLEPAPTVDDVTGGAFAQTT